MRMDATNIASGNDSSSTGVLEPPKPSPVVATPQDLDAWLEDDWQEPAPAAVASEPPFVPDQPAVAETLPVAEPERGANTKPVCVECGGAGYIVFNGDETRPCDYCSSTGLADPQPAQEPTAEAESVATASLTDADHERLDDLQKTYIKLAKATVERVTLESQLAATLAHFSARQSEIQQLIDEAKAIEVDLAEAAIELTEGNARPAKRKNKPTAPAPADESPAPAAPEQQPPRHGMRMIQWEQVPTSALLLSTIKGISDAKAAEIEKAFPLAQNLEDHRVLGTGELVFEYIKGIGKQKAAAIVERLEQLKAASAAAHASMATGEALAPAAIEQPASAPVASEQLPPCATSTTTPAGIALHDPHAQSAAEAKRNAGVQAAVEKAGQLYARVREIRSSDASENLDFKHSESSWDLGAGCFQRGGRIEDCPYVSSLEQDDWIRGFIGAEALEKYEPSKS